MVSDWCCCRRKIHVETNFVCSCYYTEWGVIYVELGIPAIISKIKKRQLNVFEKVVTMSYNESIARYTLDLCTNLPCYEYYSNLNGNVTKEENMSSWNSLITASMESTYFIRYRMLVSLDHCTTLCNELLDESKRSIISRVPQNLRTCRTCHQVEDEEYALCHCPLFSCVRLKYTAR